MKDELANSQFFITPSHPCSYLPGRQAQTLFFDPRATISRAIYQRLSEVGFRRSGSHLYRPHCDQCKECVPSRVPVSTFQPRRTQRRIMRANADLVTVSEEARFTEDYYDLYERYIHGRHRDGDMYPPSPDQFRSFLLSPWSSTFFLSTYLDNRLVAVAVTDRLDSGLSAIYTFFDPDLSSRSLGVLSILRQIEHARSLKLPFLYLGYWIADCDKMRYKTHYRPVELLVSDRWVPLV